MKNNKGFTLVELLVAMAVLAIVMVEVFNVMANSSKIYLQGSSEIGLQSEAQQVILQLEDMLVDCHGVSVNAAAGELSDGEYFSISSNDADGNTTMYYIVYTKDDPSAEYGTLELYYDGVAPTNMHVPLSDYVNSVSVNMSNYYDNDIVTLSISMNNSSYSYETTQDVFLRNMPGSNRQKRGVQPTGSNSLQMDVRRFHKYDLNVECIEEINNYKQVNGDNFNFVYEWESASATTPDSDGLTVDKYYELSSSGSIQATSYVNSKFAKEFGFQVTYTVNCFADNKSTPVVEHYPVCTIDVSTVKVQVGLGDAGKNDTSPYGYAIITPWAKNDSPYMSAIGTQGIDFNDCTKIEWEINLAWKDGIVKRDTWLNGNVSGLSATSYNIKTYNIMEQQLCPRNISSFSRRDEFGSTASWVNKAGIWMDPNGDQLLFNTTRFHAVEAYYELIDKGVIVEVVLNAEFENNDGTTQTLKFEVFTLPNKYETDNTAYLTKLEQHIDKAFDIIESF